jgi:hypothetical protein
MRILPVTYWSLGSQIRLLAVWHHFSAQIRVKGNAKMMPKCRFYTVILKAVQRTIWKIVRDKDVTRCRPTWEFLTLIWWLFYRNAMLPFLLFRPVNIQFLFKTRSIPLTVPPGLWRNSEIASWPGPQFAYSRSVLRRTSISGKRHLKVGTVHRITNWRIFGLVESVQQESKDDILHEYYSLFCEALYFIHIKLSTQK